MKLAEEIRALLPTAAELRILEKLFDSPEILTDSLRIHIDKNKTGPGVNPGAILKILRRVPQDLRVRQEAFYCLETLPTELLTLVAQCWKENYVDRPQNIAWGQEGF